MSQPFWLRFALREMRSSARRLGTYMAAITVGVAALVAINSLRAQVVESVAAESRALLGADLRLDSNRPLPDRVTAVLDSAAAAGVPIAFVTTTLSVALSDTGAVRLVQVRAVDGDYPFYGAMETEPAGMWQQLDRTRTALVERSVLEQLGANVGDSLRLGSAWFDIRGVLTALPPELSFRSAAGPRVYISAAALERAGLIRFGSLARFEAYLHIPDDAGLQQFVDRNHDTFQRAGVDHDTAADQAEDLASALEWLGRFLALVGLGALLLGGLGVASAVNVFVADRRRTVTVLRCLGASQRTAFGAYLFQAAVLGCAGALAGAVAGIAIQLAVPALLASALPIDVAFAVRPAVVVGAVLIGTLIAAIFALLPLLAVRGITPLRALRHDIEERSRRDPLRVAVLVLIGAGIALVAVWQASSVTVGLAYAAAIVTGVAVLWVCARGLATIAWHARALIGRRSFPLRQGIANLYRPRNQTTTVTIALGFGVFLIATLWVVQRNLLDWLEADAGTRPDLVFFDIQRDQVDTLRALFERTAGARVDIVPIVPAQITHINGSTINDMLETTPRQVEEWAVRREYRHTYRDTLAATETLVEGAWFSDPSGADRGAARVSIERDVARDLGVGIGDRITWDIAGIPLESVITSIRAVDWARFETNFFFVFEPGALAAAPQTAVALVPAADDTIRAALQRAVVQRFPNISVIDIATVQRTVARIIGRVSNAIRFMAAFTVAAGAIVLFGAISASRFQRVRESTLLRALGATRRQVRTIMFTEYAALGTLAGIAGTGLAAIAGWLVMRYVFEMPFTLPVPPLVLMWLGVTAAAALIGMLNSRDALRSTPLDALREADAG